MPEQIQDGRGNAYGMAVNADGSINTAISGNIIIGSVSAHVDSIYVQSGVTFVDTRAATNNSYIPTVEIVYSGTAIGSIYEKISTGSIVQVLTYSGNDALLEVGPWTAV